MKRPLIIIGLLAALLAAGTVAFYGVFITRFSNPDYLVKSIEASLNCRAEVGEAKLSLLRSPTRLALFGVNLGERDEHADAGTPLADRPPFSPSVTIDYVLLELATLPLLGQRMIVRNLTIERPHVEMRIFSDGSTSFDALIRPPSAKTEPAAEASPVPIPPGESKPPSVSRIVKASELPVTAIQGRIAIESATVVATVERSKTTVQIHDGIALFSDVDIDPSNLAEHNSANIELSAWIGVDSFEKNARYLDLSLDGNGAIQPFNPSTGELDPSLSASVTVRRDSWIDALPIIDDMEELLKQLEEYGVSFESVRLRGEFSEDTTASFNATRTHVRMTSDFMIPIDENFLVLEESSWINTAENDHEFYVTFIASERLTRKAESEIDKLLREKLGDLAAPPLKAAILQNISQGDFLVLRFQSTGDMGDPAVAALTPFGDLSDLLDTSGNSMDDLKTKAEGLLKDLFGR